MSGVHKCIVQTMPYEHYSNGCHHASSRYHACMILFCCWKVQSCQEWNVCCQPPWLHSLLAYKQDLYLGTLIQAPYLVHSCWKLCHWAATVLINTAKYTWVAIHIARNWCHGWIGTLFSTNGTGCCIFWKLQAIRRWLGRWRGRWGWQRLLRTQLLLCWCVPPFQQLQKHSHPCYGYKIAFIAQKYAKRWKQSAALYVQATQNMSWNLWPCTYKILQWDTLDSQSHLGIWVLTLNAKTDKIRAFLVWSAKA